MFSVSLNSKMSIPVSENAFKTLKTPKTPLFYLKFFFNSNNRIYSEHLDRKLQCIVMDDLNMLKKYPKLLPFITTRFLERETQGSIL